MNGPFNITYQENYTRIKDIQGGKTYIPAIRIVAGKRHNCRRGFFRARDAVAYRERVLARYARLKEAKA